jgi:hypothetical protein
VKGYELIEGAELNAGADSHPLSFGARGTGLFVNGEELMSGDWVETTVDPLADGSKRIEHSPRIIRASEIVRLALLDPEIGSLVARV